MFKKITLAVSLTWSSFAWPSASLAEVPVGPRYDWHYDTGYFHAVAGGGGAWVETINAQEAYYFQQTNRNIYYVELFDSTRNTYVRLFSNSMHIKGPNDPQFYQFKTGQWDDRRLYTFKTTDNQPSYFSLKTAEIWHWVRPGTQTLYMREILRNDDQVQLYNGAEGITISLIDRQIWLKRDGGNWEKFVDGAWAL